MNLYNDFDKDCCDWLRTLEKEGYIAPGEVLCAPIQEIKDHELKPYTQFHTFCGIGGWPLAFRLAGIPDDEPADSGSCPCQPFSGTGKQLGRADSRHLWPAFRRKINRRRAPKIYGEQVASKLGREWLAGVCSDLEIMGYGHTRADLCSAGLGSPNIRQRLFWAGFGVAEPNGIAEQQGCAVNGRSNDGSGSREIAGLSSGGRIGGLAVSPSIGRGARDGEPGSADGHGSDATGRSISSGVAESVRAGLGQVGATGRSGQDGGRSSQGNGPAIEDAGAVVRLGHADHARREGRLIRWDGGYERVAGSPSLGMWSDCELIFCRDGKSRRIEPGSFPLAYGIPARVGPMLTELRKLGRSSVALARANRNIRLKGYGNAINPWVAVAFIRAAEQSRAELGQRGNDGNVAPAFTAEDFEL